jgi:hypothetical protein
MTKEERFDLCMKHYINPEVGDYWHEMFCPYFIVLAVLDDGLYIICDEKMRVDDSSWKFNLALCKQVSFEYFSRVRYGSIDGFCADVSVGNHPAVVDAWLVMDKPVIQIEPPIIRVESEFNFCIGANFRGKTVALDKGFSYWGNMEFAKQLLVNRKEERPQYDWKLFRVEEL